jgi:hypothetical protein
MSFGNRLNKLAVALKAFKQQPCLVFSIQRCNISSSKSNSLTFGLVKLNKTNVQVTDNPKKESNDEQSSKKSNNKQTQGASPIRKLLRVKDYLDLVIFGVLIFGVYSFYTKRKEKEKNEKKYEIKWLSVPLFKHKLFHCNGFYLPEFIAKKLSELKSFEPRKDDIWIVSFPKSGLPLQTALSPSFHGRNYNY